MVGGSWKNLLEEAAVAHLQHETDGSDGAAASKPRERVAVKGCVFKDGRMLFLFKPDAARRLSIAPDLEEDLPGDVWKRARAGRRRWCARCARRPGWKSR